MIFMITVVLNISNGDQCRPKVPIVDDLMFELARYILEEAGDHLLLVGGDVLGDLTIHTLMCLPPLMKTWSMVGEFSMHMSMQQMATEPTSGMKGVVFAHCAVASVGSKYRYKRKQSTEHSREKYDNMM